MEGEPGGSAPPSPGSQESGEASLPNEEELSVTLLLNGGHSRTLYLRREDPLLSSLVSSIGEKSYGGGRPARPFNIHLDAGRRSFMFSSTDLVGLITDPPLNAADDASPSAMALVRNPDAEPQPEPEKSPYLLVDNFIDEAFLGELVKFALAREREFAAAGEGTLRLREFGRFAGLFRDRIRSLVPQLTTAFGIGEFAIGEIECALFAQNDGARAELAGEIGFAEVDDRAISYAFYFHGEPQGFNGGAFRLYNTRLAGGRIECGAPAAEIAPANNNILFFPSQCPHEVLPLRCASRRFADSRFAVIGAVRRARQA